VCSLDSFHLVLETSREIVANQGIVGILHHDRALDQHKLR
jgi:hypothetical protein